MKKKLTYGLLIGWVVTISLVITLIHSWHYIDLAPEESSPVKLADSIPTVEDFGVLHFLTPKCSCSKSIFNHLLTRGPLKYKGTKELVVTIDDDGKDFVKPLLKKGFKVLNFTTKMLHDKFSTSIKGVPLLVIYNKERVTRYVGGYSDLAITPLTEINIEKHLNTLKEGRSISSLPVIGCTVSKNYQKILDPLGLKYEREII